MADSHLQFDALLGGCHDLPENISVMNVITSRAQEILSLTEALHEPKKTGLMFQRLPRHMRRRVMSHNAKRMPRQLREAHIRQMEKSGLPPRSKRPSRKYRRRPSNLLSAYNRRMRNHIWLETHIWHAKRFHMACKWGYRLAHFPNDKSERACYRGAANHCLIQDISYHVCIEIEGEFERIIDGLNTLTRSECGPTFKSKSWIKGNRQGTVTVFRNNVEYPFGAIGNVIFLWKPTNFPDGVNEICPSTDMECEGGAETQEKRTIWLWVHPSFYSELKEELIKLFCMKPSVLSSENPSDDRERKSSDTDLGSTVMDGDYEASGIKMKMLKDNLNRFRLTGPLSLAVLRESFQLKGAEADESEEGHEWWMHWRDVFTCQRNVWKDMTAIGTLPPYSVIGLTIQDPRCNLPGKKIKAVERQVHKLELIQDDLPQEAYLSPIWNHEIREYVTRSKLTEADLNRKKGQNLVPGILETDDLKYAAQIIDGSSSRVPILLVQRPGNQEAGNNRLGYCSGWDVITPAGWGKPLWLALIFRGARASGLRESEMFDNECFSQRVIWPPLPDTNAYKVEMKQLEIESKDKYFRFPPDKRSNYAKLGISSPFSCSWGVLCHEWRSSEDDNFLEKTYLEDNYYVLRDIHNLKKISELLENKKKEAISRHKIKMEVVDESSQKYIKSFFDSLSINDFGCLVPVRLKAYKKGNIEDFAIVCLPKKIDLKSFTKLNSKFKGPVEPIHPDPNQEERKRLCYEHKKKLIKLRRKRVKERKEAEMKTEMDVPSTSVCSNLLRGPSATEQICAEHRNKMRELYLPAVTQVRNSCSREVMGFVTNGAFSYSHAKEMGIAYVTLASIISLLHTCSWNPHMLIFVRNTNSRNYIPVLIEIVKD